MWARADHAVTRRRDQPLELLAVRNADAEANQSQRAGRGSWHGCATCLHRYGDDSHRAP